MKKIKYISKSIFIALFVILLNGCTNEKLDISNNKELITKNSALFKLIDGVTQEKNEGFEQEKNNEKIVCIDFIYPLILNIYNSKLEKIGNQTLIDDNQFSAFLGSLDENYSLSIFYPILTTLSDGTVFSINNNLELKIAIDSCSKTDIITTSNAFFCNIDPSNQTPFIWNVQYKENGDNKYVSGYFSTNKDGTLVFIYDGVEYPGIWKILFFNDELHINIYLEGVSEVSNDWNFDRKIILTPDSIKIFSESKNLVLKKKYQTINNYRVGDIGPSNGVILYDKGFYNSGWRYIEVAPDDLEVLEWGCADSPILNSRNSEIGKGLYNTAAIVNFHDLMNNYYENPAICNSLNNGSVIAQKAILFSKGGNNDWFLPSIEELKLIYNNLHLKNKGDFTNSIYWSSTETDLVNVKSLLFETGEIVTVSKIPNNKNRKARAIRYF